MTGWLVRINTYPLNDGVSTPVFMPWDMDLSEVSNHDLRNEFLIVNWEYNLAISGKPSTYMFEPSFQEIRERLHAVIDELKRRRETE